MFPDREDVERDWSFQAIACSETQRFMQCSRRAISSDQSKLLVCRRCLAQWSNEAGPATSLACNWDRNWSRWQRRFQRTTRIPRSKHLWRQCFVKPSIRHKKLFGFGVGASMNTRRIALALRRVFKSPRNQQQPGQFLDCFDQFALHCFFFRLGHWQQLVPELGLALRFLPPRLPRIVHRRWLL